MKSNKRVGLTVFMGAVFLMGLSAAVYAKTDTVTAVPGTDKKLPDTEKTLIASQIQELKQLELRIVVLQQIAKEHAVTLRQKQAAFCAAYKLDVEKLRKGLYQYDAQTGKFSEPPITAKA